MTSLYSNNITSVIFYDVDVVLRSIQRRSLHFCLSLCWNISFRWFMMSLVKRTRKKAWSEYDSNPDLIDGFYSKCSWSFSSLEGFAKSTFHGVSKVDLISVVLNADTQGCSSTLFLIFNPTSQAKCCQIRRLICLSRDDILFPSNFCYILLK